MAFFGLIKNKKLTTKVVVNETAQSQKFSRTINSANYSYDFSNPMIDELVSINDVVFFGKDNLYPQLLNESYYASPLHAAICDFKKHSIAGNGYTLTPNANISEMDKIIINQFENLIDGKNNLEQFVLDITMDYVIHSRITVKTHWNDEHTKVTKFVRVQPEKVRYKKKNRSGDIYEVVLNDNWQGGGSFNINSSVTIPVFDATEKLEKCQMFLHQDSSPGLYYYSQPSYAAALNWVYADGQVSFWQKSAIENSINPSFVIQFKEKPADAEEESQVLQNIKKTYAGAAKAGKIITTFSDSESTVPNIIQMKRNDLAESFINLQDSIVRQICYASRIDPVILGIASPGSLGQSQQLQDAYQIYNDNVVRPGQKVIEGVINRFLHINKIPATFKLNPPSFSNKILNK
jgi:hypothetical protein